MSSPDPGPSGGVGAPRRPVVVVGWVATGLVVLAWRAGWGVFPDSAWLAGSIVPRLPSLPPLDPMAQYSMYSPLGSFAAAVVGARTETSFVVVHLVATIAFVAGVAVLVVRRHGWTAGGLVGAAFIGSSTAVVLLAWVGSYDVFTVGLASVLVVSRDRRVAALAGFLLAFAGFEQAVFVVVALAVLASVGIGGARRRLAWAAVGLLVGRIVLEVWLRANDVTHDRMWFLHETGVGQVVRQFGHGLPWLVSTGLGATLVAVVIAVAGLPSVRARLVVVAVFAAALVPTALALDQTRVFSILTWPVVMVLLLDHAARVEARSVRKLATVVLVLAAVVPGIVVWEGRAQLATHHVWRSMGRTMWRRVRNP